MQHKTADEVRYLYANWRADPCWDIEDTEGFEEYRDLLVEIHRRSDVFVKTCDRIEFLQAELKDLTRRAEIITGIIDYLQQADDLRLSEMWNRVDERFVEIDVDESMIAEAMQVGNSEE